MWLAASLTGVTLMSVCELEREVNKSSLISVHTGEKYNLASKASDETLDVKVTCILHS